MKISGDQPPILVSSCLAGIPCRYDGKANTIPAIRELVQRGGAIPVCAEVLGGLSTPRTPAEIKDGRVITRDGVDVTDAFRDGAREVLDIALASGATTAILKSRSPSCGVGQVYSGDFDRTLVDGDGITATLLKENGIDVVSSDNYK